MELEFTNTSSCPVEAASMVAIVIVDDSGYPPSVVVGEYLTDITITVEERTMELLPPTGLLAKFSLKRGHVA